MDPGVSGLSELIGQNRIAAMREVLLAQLSEVAIPLLVIAGGTARHQPGLQDFIILSMQVR